MAQFLTQSEFDRLDTDGSGTISRAEWTTAYGNNRDSEFERADVNRDGELTREERSAELIAHNNQRIRESRFARSTKAEMLDIAAQSPEYVYLVQFVLDTGGTDLDSALNLDGLTPLQQCVCNGNRAVAQLLLEYGANPDAVGIVSTVASPRDSSLELCPLLHAAIAKDVCMMVLLLHHGANGAATDVKGRHAVSYFVEELDTSNDTEVADLLAVTKALLMGGLRSEVAAEGAESPLAVATRINCSPLIELLESAIEIQAEEAMAETFAREDSAQKLRDNKDAQVRQIARSLSPTGPWCKYQGLSPKDLKDHPENNQTERGWLPDYN